MGGILDWCVREMRAMCRLGLHGVIAVGIVVTVLLNIPVWLLEKALTGRWPIQF
jgi:hypothetical protein